MNSFCDFVLHGNLGQLSLGLPQRQVIQLLGPPADWLDKASIVSKPCPAYEKSLLWFYYKGSVGIRFDNAAISREILLYPEKFTKRPELFRNWPITENVTMGEWRAALAEYDIEFRESNPETDNYWIIAAQTCVASGFPFDREGLRRAGYERPVSILSKYSDARTMMDECKFIGLP